MNETSLCAYCGEKPVRKYSNAGRRMSQYCSNGCGVKAKSAKMRELVAGQKGEPAKQPAVKPQPQKNEARNFPRGSFDWRDAQYNPMG